MADVITRPTFHEGQYVGADDLNGVVAQAAGWQGRHARLMHSWGIVSGLGLTGAAKKTAGGQPYVDVTLGRGMAIDGHGYEIVVGADTLLSPALFDQSSVAGDDETAWYPVFLVGVERVQPATSSAGACGTAQSTRVVESFQIEFDGAGQQAAVDLQPRPTGFAEGPGTGAARPAWKILLGYVQWSAALKRFTAVTTEPQDGVGRRHAGVRAAEVIAPAGEVVVRTDEREVAQKTVLVVTSAGDDAIVVGRQDGAGGMARLLTVTKSGDVEAAGVIKGVVTGGTHVQSGSAVDGARLPLPAGIDPANVASGVAQLHVHVTPRLSWKGPPGLITSKVPLVEHCYVDDTLRVRCQIRWANPTNLAGDFEVHPGVVDYLVVVAVQEASS
jgi:hypothetical protein